MSNIVAITGAAGDIGHAMALRFLKRGCQVAAIDIDEAALIKRRGSLDAGSRYHPIAADMTDSASVKTAFGRIKADIGALDVLINNAGGISGHNLRSTSEAQWLRDIDLNLNGAWRAIKNVIDDFAARRRGVIINIASVNGLGIFGHPGYSAAKAGLIHLTKFAAVELGPHGVRAVALCPGTVKTQAWVERQRKNPDIIADAMQWYPSREASEPDSIAKMAEFAALDAPPTLNGAVITIDGGLTAGQDSVASAFCGEPL